METQKGMRTVKLKYVILAVALCSVLAFSTGLMISNENNSGMHSKNKPGANVFVTIETDMGTYDIPIINLITDIGESQACTRFRTDDTFVSVKYISLSNDASASAAWTQLPNEATENGSARVVATVSAAWTYSGDTAYNLTKKFTFTDGGITLQCAGANWASSGDNNLYAAANFAQTAFAVDWNLTITWIFVYDGN